MLAGLADNERFCYFLNTFVTQNSIQKDQFPANIFERFEARRQEDLNLRPLA